MLQEEPGRPIGPGLPELGLLSNLNERWILFTPWLLGVSAATLYPS